MSKVKASGPGYFGGLGYPMMMTTLAGMELLGGLTINDSEEFDANKGRKYFLHYWDTFFTVENESYKGLGGLFYELIRHGLVHTYVAKQGIFIEKGSNKEISIDQANQQVYVDCNIFYKEFKASYQKLVRPTLDDIDSKDHVQKRLDSMTLLYSANSKKRFVSLSEDANTNVFTKNRIDAPLSKYASEFSDSKVAKPTGGATGPIGSESHAYSVTTSSRPDLSTTTIPPDPTTSGTLTDTR
jgi:hypothetical protein